METCWWLEVPFSDDHKEMGCTLEHCRCVRVARLVTDAMCLRLEQLGKVLRFKVAVVCSLTAMEAPSWIARGCGHSPSGLILDPRAKPRLNGSHLISSLSLFSSMSSVF